MDNSTITFNILSIKEGTIVDGIGLRTSIYVAGCHHKCEGCHNPQSWDFSNGQAMTIAEIIDVVKRNGKNVTLTGGDPIYQPNLPVLLQALRGEGCNVWLYTGFLFEELLSMKDASVSILPLVDVMVDGRYDASKRDSSLRFRGSSNQRIINVKKSLEQNKAILFTT